MAFEKNRLARQKQHLLDRGKNQAGEEVVNMDQQLAAWKRTCEN